MKTGPKPIPLKDRLLETKSGCLEFIGNRDKDGYGKMKFNGKDVRSHRVAYVLAHGTIPENMQVCHSCDNPPCCNPKHLFLGTNKDNNNDKVRKMRHGIGEKNGRAKLTEEEVLEIREKYKTKKYFHKDLAKDYNVSIAVIARVTRGDSWSHVK